MNIGQQVGIEKLFSKINKSLQKNPKETISDTDLNKLRAYVIKSQRPLQAVKLLEKEREEREADYKFIKQKEEIIEQAQALEQEKAKFKRDQMEMIKQVKDSMGTIIQNANKRKLEEAKREKEKQKEIENTAKIKELQKELDKKRMEYDAKKKQLEKYKKYTEFLEEVVNSDNDNREFQDIESLKDRFKILRKEHENLTNKQNDINKKIWEVKQEGKKKMDSLQNELYVMQRKMHSNQNTKLEPKLLSTFDTGKINKESTNSMVITAVNNMYEMCVDQMHKNKKKAMNVNNRVSNAEMDTKLMKVLTENISKDKSSENSNLLQTFMKKLETIRETIEDLKEVAKLVPDYSKESVIAAEANGTAKNGGMNFR